MNVSVPLPGGLMSSERGTLAVRGIPGGNSAPDTYPIRGREVRMQVL